MPQPWTSSASASLHGDTGPVTLVDESAFCVSNGTGDLVPGLPHGFIFRDTRFLSELRVRMNGVWPEPLAANTEEPFSATFVVQDRPQPGRADSSLLLIRRRYVGRGMREDIIVRNYGREPAFCALEILLDCDFADLFEVKEGRVEPRDDVKVHAGEATVEFSYARGRFRRGTIVAFSHTPRIAERTVMFELIVPAGGEWNTCVQVTPVIDGEQITPRHLCGLPVARSTPSARLDAWRRRLPRVASEHPTFAALFDRSTEDLAALRIFDPEYPDRAVVAAGAPWFMTLFGRDSLLTSWMAMVVDPDLALGTLQTLARFQGTDVDPITEEEPGRILHEMRFGESATLSLGGGGAYYGTVDATPLFVMLLGELQRWSDRRDEVDALLPAADRGLAWIEGYGDRDGDGYVEYQRTSDVGLRNQGWKDSWDGVRFADGRLAEPPIALCEVQGYVYGALTARAYFALEQGDTALAGELAKRAAELKRRFNEDFWLDEHGYFAMGLDAEKRPLDALASNMGHCLWTGIVDNDRAAVVADRLVSDACFSGWGIRTLATSMTGYNPASYHCGSVWPHDNAIAVAGMMRYGFVDHAHRVMCGLVDAAEHFGLRLPELFTGLSRDEVSFPVAYPTSCSPQAWAAAAPLLFLRSMLRFEPDLRLGRLHVAPAVPEWIGRLRLENVPLGHGRVSLEVEGDELAVLEQPEGIEVVSEPRGRIFDEPL